MDDLAVSSRQWENNLGPQSSVSFIKHPRSCHTFCLHLPQRVSDLMDLVHRISDYRDAICLA